MLPNAEHPIDLSPFQLSELHYKNRTLRFRQPLELVPHLDDTRQLICLTHSALGIDVCASTREELEQALHEELDVLWRNYAMADPGWLTPGARRMRENLLASIEQ
jgi:hypothetical protein